MTSVFFLVPVWLFIADGVPLHLTGGRKSGSDARLGNHGIAAAEIVFHPYGR
jgi:hypothetical protein